MPTDQTILEETFKILLTVFLSSIIGIERELRQKGAGLRTHILVSVGSALITLTSLFFCEQFRMTPTIVDPTRLITGIITGIGFLCGGAILHDGDSVRGLTTAATLWIVCGVGISVGAGHYSGAIIVTVTVVLVLIGVRKLEHHLYERFIKNNNNL